MNITFIIGNGFDLGLGLKSSYEDFYNEYCVVTENDNENIRKFKRILEERNNEEANRIIDWADFEIAFGQHSENFTIAEKALYIERFEDFVSKFNSYLENEEANIDYTNERAISEMMQTAVSTYFHIRPADRNEIEKTYKAITDYRIYNFISFNYTKTVDKCAQILLEQLERDADSGVGEIAHIHGYVDENMIMGVNDTTQISNLEFAEDTGIISEIVKPQQNIEARTMYEDKVNTLISNSDIICIYGMSIGATDKKWWDIISRWLYEKPLGRLIVLKYDKKYSKRFVYRQTVFTNEVIDTFLSHSDLLDDEKEMIKSRIYVDGNHNVFEMQLRKEMNAESGVVFSKEEIENIVYQETSSLTQKVSSLERKVDTMPKVHTEDGYNLTDICFTLE